MKMEITESAFRDAFHAHGRGDSFSYDGLSVLFSFLESDCTICDGSYDLDVIALDCAWTEYKTALAAAQDLGVEISDPDGDPDEVEAEALAGLQGRWTVIEIPSGGLLIGD